MPATVDPSALAASLQRIETRAGDRALVGDLLQHVVEACVALFPVEGGGLMLADDHGDLRYVVATDPPATLLEEAQIRTGSGPCVDAYVTDAIATTADVQNDDRYPDLRESLSDSGIRAVLGVPVHVSGICVASLDVYRSTVGDWHLSETEAVARFAQVIEVMLATAVAADTSDTLAQQLSYALKHRVPVERGIGYLMAVHSIDATAAFNLLRTAARRQRRTVSDVAVGLLRDGSLEAPPETAQPTEQGRAQ